MTQGSMPSLLLLLCMFAPRYLCHASSSEFKSAESLQGRFRALKSAKVPKGLKSQKGSKTGTKAPKSAKAPTSTKATKAIYQNLLLNQKGANIPDGAFCYKVPFFNSQGEELGTVFDCVTSEIIPLDDTFSIFQFDAGTTFHFETGSGDELTITCVVTSSTTVPPVEKDYNAATTCYDPNGVVSGKGIYEGVSGSVKLEGIVNNTQFAVTGELNFDLEWQIQLN